MSTCNNAASGRGFTLYELLLLIVIFAIAMAGILVIYKNAVAGSPDPMVRKQAMAAAESMMDEILLQPFAVGGWTGAATQGNRQNFDDVRDYNGFATTGIYRIDDPGPPAPPTTGLTNYNLSVQVLGEALVASGAAPDVPLTDALRVRVIVTGPNVTYTLDGYKLNYN